MVATAPNPETPSRLALSIVIVTWNSGSVIGPCLASLFEHPAADGQEIIVVDNASADSTVEFVSSSYPEVSILQSGRNIGYGRGLNLGAARARGEFLLLLNPDVRVGPGSIDAMLAAMRSDQGVGVVGSEQRALDGSFKPAGFFGYPSVGGVILEALRYPTYLQRRFFSSKRANHVEPGASGGIDVDWVLGSVVGTRTSLFRELGGFDEFIFLYIEEIDFCLRVKKLARRVVYVAGHPVVHDGGSDAGPWSGPRKVSFFLSLFYFVKKHEGLAAYAALRAGFAAAVVWSSVYENTKRPFRPNFPVRSALKIALLRLRPMYGAT